MPALHSVISCSGVMHCGARRGDYFSVRLDWFQWQVKADGRDLLCMLHGILSSVRNMVEKLLWILTTSKYGWQQVEWLKW
jgi:hypothetical protein